MMSGFMTGERPRVAALAAGLLLAIGAGSLAGATGALAQAGATSNDPQTVITIKPPAESRSSLPGVNLDTPGVLPSEPPVPGAPSYLNQVTGQLAESAASSVPDGWVDGWHGTIGPGIPLPLPF